MAFQKLFLLRKRFYRNIKCFVFQIVVNPTMSTVSGECPTNETSWRQRSTKFCSNSQEYHCLPTIFLNESVEICLTVKLLQRGTNIIKIVYTNNSSQLAIFPYMLFSKYVERLQQKMIFCIIKGLKNENYYQTIDKIL